MRWNFLPLLLPMPAWQAFNRVYAYGTENTRMVLSALLLNARVASIFLCLSLWSLSARQHRWTFQSFLFRKQKKMLCKLLPRVQLAKEKMGKERRTVVSAWSCLSCGDHPSRMRLIHKYFILTSIS